MDSCAAVGVTFHLAARATGGVDRATRRDLPGLMAHSLIPIVIGYVVAHYLTYLVERGQQPGPVLDLEASGRHVHDGDERLDERHEDLPALRELGFEAFFGPGTDTNETTYIMIRNAMSTATTTIQNNKLFKVEFKPSLPKA